MSESNEWVFTDHKDLRVCTDRGPTQYMEEVAEEPPLMGDTMSVQPCMAAHAHSRPLLWQAPHQKCCKRPFLLKLQGSYAATSGVCRWQPAGSCCLWKNSSTRTFPSDSPTSEWKWQLKVDMVYCRGWIIRTDCTLVPETAEMKDWYSAEVIVDWG